MLKHKIKLEGPAAKGARISARTLASILGTLEETAKRSLRLRVEARSNLQGMADWLDATTNFEFVGLSEGSTVLEFEAPSIEEAAPFVLELLPLWDNMPGKDDTAFSIVEDTLRQAQAGNRDSDVLDRNVLSAVAEFQAVLNCGYDAIVFNGTSAEPVRVTGAGLQMAEWLRHEAPHPERVIISGWLDQVTNSQRSFQLLLPDKQVVRGVFPDGALAPYAAMWGTKVVIDGELRYRPSGAPSVIFATHVQAASPADSVWEQVPPPSVSEISALRPRIPAALGKNGMERVFGKWPGDESTEELLEALQTLG